MNQRMWTRGWLKASCIVAAVGLSVGTVSCSSSPATGTVDAGVDAPVGKPDVGQLPDATGHDAPPSGHDAKADVHVAVDAGMDAKTAMETSVIDAGVDSGKDAGPPACSPTCTAGAACTEASQCGSGVCTAGACAAAACAPACGDSTGCGASTDCASGVCTAGKCAAPACSPTCADGNVCGAAADCGSGVCTAGKCAAPACSPACADGNPCGAGADCATGVCTDGSCTAAACSPTCADGNLCGAATDCASGVCTAGKCAAPACSPTCVDGNVCGATADCASGVCTAGKCVAPACSPTCVAGKACGGNGDCESGICTAGVCTDAVSCAALLTANPAAKTGLYEIKPTGAAAPIVVDCDMVTDGGGWTQYATLAVPVTAPANGALAGSIVQIATVPTHTRVMVLMLLNANYAWASWDVGANLPSRWLLNETGTFIQEVENNGHSGTNTTIATVQEVRFQNWNECYSPNTTANAYEWLNTGIAAGVTNCYGTFSTFTGAATLPPTLFALDHWATAATVDIGIGNGPAGTPPSSGNPDWTFAANAASFTTRTLSWYVH